MPGCRKSPSVRVPLSVAEPVLRIRFLSSCSILLEDLAFEQTADRAQVRAVVSSHGQIVAVCVGEPVLRLHSPLCVR